MPTPKAGESRDKFVARCIPYVKKEDSSLTDKQAAGKCNGIYDQHKKKKSLRARLDVRALSLSQRQSLIRTDWDATYGMEPPYLYPYEIYDDYIVVSYGGRFIRIDYELQDNIAVFADPEEWSIVEMEFKGVGVPEPRILVPQAIKAIDDDRYQSYVVQFGDADHKDLEGTYFNEATNYYLDWYKTRPWLYHHGLNPHLGAVKIGTWDEYGQDDAGVFFRGELEKAFRYREAVQQLLDEEELYPSTGALGYLVRVAEDGWVSDWPIAEASSTVTPAEFRIGPFKPTVVKAVNTLQGGITMNEVVGKAKKALDRLVNRKADEEVPGASEEDEAQESISVGSDEAEESVELVQEPETPEAPEEETPEAEEASTPEPVFEGRSAELDTLIENQGRIVEAITGLDQLAQDQAAEIKALRQTIEELTKTKAEQIKSALASGSGDWFNQLYVHSRDGEETTRTAPRSTVQAQDEDEDGGSPYLQIRRAQGAG